MIRITQTYLINLTVKHFSNLGWQLLYKDLPGGRRSGVGLTASINKLWEGIYNLSPDILLYKDGELLLFEVDSTLNDEYIGKLQKYRIKEDELIRSLEKILDSEIKKIGYGFVAKNVQTPKNIPKDLCPFISIGYDKESKGLVKMILK